MPKTNKWTLRKGRRQVTIGPSGGAVVPVRGPFRPTVRLDPSKVRDLRGSGRSGPEEVITRLVGGVQTMRQNLGRMLGGRDISREIPGRVRAHKWASRDQIQARLAQSRIRRIRLEGVTRGTSARKM